MTYKGPTEIGHFSTDRGTSYSFDLEGHNVQLYVTAKRKLIRVFIDHEEWERPG